MKTQIKQKSLQFEKTEQLKDIINKIFHSLFLETQNHIKDILDFELTFIRLGGRFSNS